MQPLSFRDAASWEAWLKKHHGESEGVWLLIAKKGASRKALEISDALDVALCFGWIDSQRKGHDADSYLQRYSRRRPGSPWSERNVQRAETLIAQKRMHAPGLAEIEAARGDGRWAAAYAPQREVTVPAELTAALARDPAAKVRFAALNKTERYALLLPILKATTPAQRAKCVELAIARLGGATPAARARKGCRSSVRTNST
jgi:uncharacterized protein YdeI (YjbR/CyaY-like superfamily)